MNVGEIDLEVLRGRLSRVFGQDVRSLRRIRRGAQSVNCEGIRQDGLRFVLKLVPFARERQYRFLVDHLESAAPGPVVRELLPRNRFDIMGCHALLLEWCAGTVVPFDRLFDGLDPAEFLLDYGRFSASVQNLHDTYPAFDYAGMMETVVNSPVGALLDEEFRTTDFRILAPTSIIHGDLQPDNLRFRDGRLSAVLDVEEFRPGVPVEDFARYVCCSAGRIPWYRPDRRRQLQTNLIRLVKAAPHSTEEWTAALRGQLVKHLFRFARRGKTGAFRRVSLKRHVEGCRRFVEIIRGAR